MARRADLCVVGVNVHASCNHLPPVDHFDSRQARHNVHLSDNNNELKERDESGPGCGCMLLVGL